MLCTWTSLPGRSGPPPPLGFLRASVPMCLRAFRPLRDLRASACAPSSAFISIHLRIDQSSSLRRSVAALRASFPVPLGLPLTHGWVKGPARSAGRKKCPLFHAPMIDAHLLHLVHLLATSARPRLRIHRVRTPKAFPLRAPRLGVPEPESRIPACSLSPQSWNGHFSRHSAWRSALSLEVFSPFSPLSVFPFEPECSASPAREDSADAPAEDWAGSSNPRSATLDTR